MKIRQLAILLYLVLSIVYIYSDQKNWSTVPYLTKPLLMLVLLIYYRLSVTDTSNSFVRYIMLALVFAMAGDTFLLFANEVNGQNYFMLGLGSFLFTHLCYIFGFLKLQKSQPLLRRQPFWAIPFLIYLVALSYYLWPDIPDDLKVPVAVYSMTIVTMGVVVLNLYQQINKAAFYLLLSGALLFIFSDSIIAINKFKADELNVLQPRLSIMLTYLIGQYLIVAGSLRIRN